MARGMRWSGHGPRRAGGASRGTARWTTAPADNIAVASSVRFANCASNGSLTRAASPTAGRYLTGSYGLSWR